LVNLKDYLKYRKDNNIEVSFEEKDIEKRIDPKLTFPNCKSIIVVGLSYNVDFKIEKQDKPMGLLSKSSWGIDYHRVLNKKIEALINEIKRKVNFEYRYFVDTGPLIERELAQKA